MDESSINAYRCPVDRSALRFEGASTADGAPVTGDLVSAAGRRYRVEGGIPDFTDQDSLSPAEARVRSQYDSAAETGAYDASVDWMFAAFREDEGRAREAAIDMLALEPAYRVLEVGCGTGRDSHRIARRLAPHGSLFVADLSPVMVSVCRERMAEHHRANPFRCTLEYSVANALSLPFAPGYFDAVFHAGGFNQFSNAKRAAAEFARVVKPGGAVLISDESIAPWLRGTEFARIVCANNPLFDCPLPLDALPECAGDVSVRYFLGNCFYVISFRNHDGPPPLDLDLPHKGRRGGTLRSRYFGVLEGVTPEAKELAHHAAARSGVSVHEWLDRLVRRQAADDLADDPRRSR